MRCFVVSILTMATIASCGLVKKSKSDDDTVRILVHGDPTALIHDTDMNTNSFIKESNVEEFNGYFRGKFYIFSEKSEYILTKNPEKHKKNTKIIKEAISIFEFDKNNDSNLYTYTDEDNNYSFDFQSDDKQHLNLIRIRTNNKESYDLTTLHYSISADKSQFSFLASFNNKKSGKSLLSVTFFHPKIIFEANTVKTTVKNFNYLAGNGVKSAWKLNDKGQVKIDVCPSTVKGMAKQFENYSLEDTQVVIRNAIKEWEQPFKSLDKKFSIDIRFPKRCKPFSDVNQHAIYWIGDYLTYTPDNKNYGVALVETNPKSSEIITSDILLFESEINKLDKEKAPISEKRSETRRALIHEVGHFLGLDHNFEDNHSIMSYKVVEELGRYDKEAIYELYSDQLSDSNISDAHSNNDDVFISKRSQILINEE